MQNFKNLNLVDHPLVQDRLSRMRDASCDCGAFRRYLREIGVIMGVEATRGLGLANRKIETPMTGMDAPFLTAAPPVIVPILRAGLGMADGVADIIPESAIGHIGLYRDEETKRPVEYLVRLPEDRGNLFIVVDPMLATGYSAAYACDLIKRHGVAGERMVLLSLIAAPEGVAVMEAAHPDVKIFTAALDERLDERCYILPGLGDAGDRLYGT